MIPEKAKKVFSGVLSDVYQWPQEMFDGTVETFEVIKHLDTTEVIAIQDGKIMIQQQEQPGGQVFLCVPGGRIETGEQPLEGAKRELLEETGFGSDQWHLYHHQEASGHIHRNFYVFVAQDCTFIQEQQLDPGERIKIQWVTLDELIDLVDQGTLTRMEYNLRIDLIRAKYHQPAKEELERKIFGNPVSSL